jgi:hypothetical protein
MDPLTGEAVPAAALRADLGGGDPAAAQRALAALARAQAAGLDVSAIAGARAATRRCRLVLARTAACRARRALTRRAPASRAADCLPPLVLSEELALPARRMACDVLRNATLSGARAHAAPSPRLAARADALAAASAADAQWVALAAASTPLVVSEARPQPAPARRCATPQNPLTRSSRAPLQAQPAALRFALLGLAASYPRAAAAAALAGSPSLEGALGARDPALRAAAAAALAPHLASALPGGAADASLLRRLVTAAGDASPEACAAAFAALGRLFGCVAGERPGAAGAAAPAPPACRAAALAAEDAWSARRELLARAAKLPPTLRVAAVYPLVRPPRAQRTTNAPLTRR